MQHDWSRDPASISMNWSVSSVCLVKQAYEHYKFLAFLKKYILEINPIFTRAWL